MRHTANHAVVSWPHPVAAAPASLAFSNVSPLPRPTAHRPPAVSNNGADITPITTTIRVTPPFVGGPFSSYRLTACPQPGTAADCQAYQCQPADVNACPINNLTPATK